MARNTKMAGKENTTSSKSWHLQNYYIVWYIFITWVPAGKCHEFLQSFVEVKFLGLTETVY